MFEPAYTHQPTRTHRTGASPRRRTEGVTLVELMIVVTIVGLLAMAIAPSFGHMLADQRQAAVPRELSKLIWRARGRGGELGKAMLLRFDQSASQGLGMVELWTGMTNRCQLTDWNQAFGAPAGSPLRPTVSDQLDVGRFNGFKSAIAGEVVPTASDKNRQVITLRLNDPGASPPGPVGAADLCYQPNGAAMIRTGPNIAGLSSWRALGMEVRFRVQRFIDNGSGPEMKGVTRELAIAPGGFPRIL